MGIFTRFRDIVSSNISAMLDKAEDPEKLIKLMIREMEDTLVELKASCAGVMANRKKVQRHLDEMHSRTGYWARNAKLAVEKGRDDLAREALVEKRRFAERVQLLEKELFEHNQLVEQYQEDIRELEDRLRSARDKQRMLVQRHIRAQSRKQAQEEIRRIDGSEALLKFEQIESRIERMEADADLVNFGRKPRLEGEFDGLLVDDEIEKELLDLKSSASGKGQKAPTV
ncbi:MAG: phage shock protein PspA [Deltaproteobacteria bacterium]